MQPSKTPFPPGLIAICSGDLPRFKQFEKSIRHIIVPEGSRDCDVEGMSIAAGRNLAIRDFMADYHQWVWFVDDDNPLHPELLMWLLNRDVDIIQPLVVNRKPPYVSHCHRFNDDHTSLDIVPWDEIPGEGLFECDGVGAGGMLIQRRVLDAMDDPWFRTGEQNIEHIQEDTSFCIRAKQLGFHVFTDLDHSIGHCHTHTVYPTHEGGRWRIQHVIGAGYVFMSEPDHPVSALTS